MEQQMLEALCVGEHKAFEEIFTAYYNKISYFINGLLKSEADSEELTQDIFVKLWINRQSIDPKKSFNAYIYTVARNAAFNFLKHKFVETSYLENYTELNEVAHPEQLIFAKEISLLVELTVGKMPVQRKTIYQLSRDQDLSNEEIALQLGIAKKTVENQLSLALQELRRIIHLFLVFFM
ncbi:MAG TPA: RNA polymerase sigma-70 factor [Bacteroidales bacterium]